MALPGFENFGLNISGILRIIWIAIQVMLAFGVVGAAFYFGIFKRIKFKDVIHVIDPHTLQVTSDNGYLRKYRDGHQDYILRRHKDAKMSHPPSSGFTTIKGKKYYEVMKYGPGDYNWAALSPKIEAAKDGVKEFEVMDLTTENFAKTSIFKASERKAGKTFFDKYGDKITIMGGLLIIFLMFWWTLGIAKEAIAIGGATIQTAGEAAKECRTYTSNPIPISPSEQPEDEPPPGI